MKKEATIYDIAKELKISASTVSRALKGNQVINKDTRKKVIRCAEKMGYRSNAFASNLRTRRTNAIGVIVPRLDSTFMSACIAGMEEFANEKGYNLIISQSRESVFKEEQITTTMFNTRVDGVIASLTVEESDRSYFDRFADKNVPVVFFDRVPENDKHVCFIIDNYKAAFQATEHLISQGCKNLLHITIDSTSNVYTERYRGFLSAIEKRSCNGKVLFLDSLTLESGKKVVDKILNTNLQPDGIFVSNDLAAVGCLLGLSNRGIRIPEDMAVVGFNNDPVSTIVTPHLSTISYPGRKMGMLAAKSLIEHLNGENSIELTHKVVLSSRLIIRESSKRE